MSSSASVASAQRLQALFLKLHAIMTAEHEENSIRGVSHVLAVLAEAEADPGVAADRVAEAKSFFRSMAQARSPFSEFFIWREDFEQRVRKNRELDAIKESIWQEFEANV